MTALRHITPEALQAELASVLAAVEQGATYLIERDGHEVARLTPAQPIQVNEARADYAAAPAPVLPPSPTALTRLLGSRAARDVLGVFVLNPERAIHQREIARRAGVGLRSAQLALDRLERLGLITSERDGNRRNYRAHRTPGFEALRAALSREYGLVGVLAAALEPFASQIQWAFIFGSAARGDDRVDSDVDLMVVGNVSDDALAAPLAAAQRELGREIDVVTYRLDEFEQRLAAGGHFVTSVLDEPRIDVIGRPDDA